jgi:hypothetical protein
MNTTMNTGAASLSDEQLDDILNEHWNYQGVPRVSHIIDAMRAAISVALSIATPQADAAPLVDGLPPLPAPLEIEWPELHSQALGCGVEDRGIHDRYEAAEYGWQDGVDRAAERVPEEIFTADQMREYARAAIAAGGAQEAATREEIEHARDRVLAQSKNSLFRSGAKICAAEILSPTKPCTKPPEGWTCSRIEGHEGPCAASPAASNGEQA